MIESPDSVPQKQATPPPKHIKDVRFVVVHSDGQVEAHWKIGYNELPQLHGQVQQLLQQFSITGITDMSGLETKSEISHIPAHRIKRIHAHIDTNVIEVVSPAQIQGKLHV